MPTARDSLLGRYRVAELIGRGSFGRVLKVIDTQTSEPRALKIALGPAKHRIGAAAAEAMLFDEFEQLARLSHPSLPRVFEVGRTSEPIDDVAPGAPFFIAEWIAGGRCDTRRWDDPRALWALLADIAGALAVIHAAGLVHGDVTPANILLVEGKGEHRAVLVDLGLASGEGARGTPQFMAPEALAGHVEPRSDLYSLGATAVRLVTGRPLYDAPTLGELVHKIVTAGPPPALSGMPRPLADLIGRLVARDADARPQSALALLDELDQLAPVIAPGLARSARPKVGAPPAAAAWPGAEAVVEPLARGLAGRGFVHVVAGVVASGARQLVDRAIRKWQLDEVARGRRTLPVIAGGLDEVAVRLMVAPQATAASLTPESGRRWIDAVARGVGRVDALVVFELADDPRQKDLINALVRVGLERPAVVIVDEPVAARDDLYVHLAPSLDEDGVRTLATAMLGPARGAPPRAWLQGLYEASGGLPLTTIELLRSIGDEADPFAIDWAERSTVGAAELRGRQLRAVSAPARSLVLAIAVWSGRTRFDRALATARAQGDKVGLADVVELERAGLLRRRGDELAIDRATAEAAEADAGKLVATYALAGLADARASSDAPLDALAALLSRVPMTAERAELACEVAEQLLVRGRADRARGLAEHAIATSGARAGLIAARAAAAVGAYRDVEPLARAAQAAGADAVEAQLVIARAAQRGGDLDAAETTLAALYAQSPEHAEVAGTYARLLVTRSRFADARAVATAGGALAGLRAEAAGLAAFYLGELDEADQAFAALELGGAATGDGATVGRALSLRGMVAQQRGQLGLASDRYREAARKLDEVGEVHAAAVAELNLGTALSERGRASEALPRLAAASRVFAELGAITEHVAADLNRGNALLALGQADDAYAAADAALAYADGAPHLRAFALLVLGDSLRRLGEEKSAERAYRDALAIGVERADAHAQVSAYVALAEAGHAVDADVEALCASADDRDRWTVARGRLAVKIVDARRNRTGSYASLRDSAPQPIVRDAVADEAAPVGRGTGPTLARSSRMSGAHAALTGSHPALRDSSPLPALGDAAGTGSHAALRDPSRHSSSNIALRIPTGSNPALRSSTSDRTGSNVALRIPSGDPRTGSNPALRMPALRDTGSSPAMRYAELEGPSDADLVALAHACGDVATRAADADRLERAFRANAVAAMLAQRGRDAATARTFTDRARGAHAAMVAAAAPVFRASLEADPDLVALPGGEAPAALRFRDDGAAHLRRLLTLSRRLNTEASVERILDEVIDTAIELTAAERGFLLLRQADGELAPVVSRNFAMGDLESGERSVSRSIAERAAQTGEPVVTVDAGVDERFAVAASVAALRLRSVLVVPLRQRGVITGCIYVDHRLRGGAFDEAAATLLGELADIAAIAIENTRLTDDLRRSTREVDELNRRLSAELAERESELIRVKADLPDRSRLRNPFDAIAGRSPAMLRMLDVLDRASATALPVVIVGESGTGKELVARALHDHGPRRDGAFVAINCSAVPEQLLESELFGHVRGSFTGAERDRRGLFEVADGGTLFLDEIADTSPAMQAKLLRVLQDGMIRRVGDTKTRKVDVRVIAASQRSLAELAATGKFREDLRFRLEVITIPVPPLRERDGDIPLLVERLLAQLSPGRTPPRLTRSALRALGQHRWPGNVRELENALARGVAMGGDVIDVADLPEAVAASGARPEPAKPAVGEDLRLKPALTATEQAYITAAMNRAKGNQTVAARLLGLSRFGLQKKLRRLSGEDDNGGDDD
ncbi:MAG TPA: sigma 54-interacting transcriptional regulator [Kofleriaceae bacterium]